ncbi:MAG: zinc ribbon domain-containing protein [Bacteroidetes bacterium]|nr:zinc ribbon domain-containing protein [Bacteroidota bacterium]
MYKCGHTSKENRKTRSKFKCMACGHTDHADMNASANVLQASGIGASTHGGAFSLETPMSRKMDLSVAT